MKTGLKNSKSPPPKRNPFREMCIGDDREIQHVNYFAVKKSCIAVRRKQAGGVLQIGITVVEDQAIEHAVEEISNGSCINEGSANNEALVISLPDDFLEVERSEDHGTSKSVRIILPMLTKLPTIGHPHFQ